MSAGDPGSVTAAEANEIRATLLEGWEQAAAGWSKRAERVREWGMPVSVWMIDRLGLQPGQRVLELAAGPGDTGFLAAELIVPGGKLISSDGAEAMLEVARARAARLGIGNVEFRRLELEWIDLPTADVDAILCRWGLMLCVDPEAGLRESRRVLRPGGRIALAVWDQEAHNPWATLPIRALIEHGYEPGTPGPGMFALAAPGRLAELLEAAGFLDVVVATVDLERSYPSADAFVEESLDLSRIFREGLAGLGLSASDRAGALRTLGELLGPFTAADGSVRLPGRSLVAAGEA